ncbi:unnamed protein product [Cylicocyclus nassatus]|uniref:Uncharacterized protein n=1 Tax=Cylicocyclus nassatus TaxID=53992 RepID=A0AA36H2Z1_CYLNA|nr:unnamed protein product [Cylicocyclus nassatus]
MAEKLLDSSLITALIEWMRIQQEKMQSQLEEQTRMLQEQMKIQQEAMSAQHEETMRPEHLPSPSGTSQIETFRVPTSLRAKASDSTPLTINFRREQD